MRNQSFADLDAAITRFMRTISDEDDKALACQAMAFAEHIYAAMRAYKAQHGEIPYIVVLKAIRGLAKTVLREMENADA